MSAFLHCDECGTCRRGPLAAHFIHITEQGSTLHFCSWDCILRHCERIKRAEDRVRSEHDEYRAIIDAQWEVKK